MNHEELDEMVVTEGGDLELSNKEVNVGNAEHDTDEEEEDVITIEGETPPVQDDEDMQQAPKWVKELRKKYRTQTEEFKQVKAELDRVKNGNTQPKEENVIPTKPKLEDFDYDAEDYEKALDSWYKVQREYESKENERAKARQQQEEESKIVIDKYNKAKEALKVKDFDVIEDLVVDKLPIEMQNVILNVSDNPAVIVYAIGKNKAKLEELSKLTNPFLFAKEIGKMEGKLKVERRTTAPEPEKVIKGTAGASSSSDAKLDRLREEAMKSGDMSKVMAYKKSIKK